MALLVFSAQLQRRGDQIAHSEGDGRGATFKVTLPISAVASSVELSAGPTRQFRTEPAFDKPEHIRPKIAEGKLKAWMGDVVLLNQPHVNSDKYEGKTIEQIRANLAGTTASTRWRNWPRTASW